MSDFKLKRKAIDEANRIYKTQSEFSIKRTLVRYYLQVHKLKNQIPANKIY